jgi:hypothetical protein
MIQALNFTPQALAGIFLGTITKWNDLGIAYQPRATPWVSPSPVEERPERAQGIFIPSLSVSVKLSNERWACTLIAPPLQGGTNI